MVAMFLMRPAAANGGPQGLRAWLAFAKSRGKKLAIGEWGVVICDRVPWRGVAGVDSRDAGQGQLAPLVAA